MKAHEQGLAAAGHPPPPGSAAYPHHPHPAAAHHQLMDMYSGMTPATAINTMDWKNTSQVGQNFQLSYFYFSLIIWFGILMV